MTIVTLTYKKKLSGIIIEKRNKWFKVEYLQQSWTKIYWNTISSNGKTLTLTSLVKNKIIIKLSQMGLRF